MGFRLSLCDIPTLIRNMLCKGSVHRVLPSLHITEYLHAWLSFCIQASDYWWCPNIKHLLCFNSINRTTNNGSENSNY